jgi:hypothetical protein
MEGSLLVSLIVIMLGTKCNVYITSGTHFVHGKRYRHPRQRRQQNFGEILRQECIPYSKGTESFREESVQQDPPRQCRNNHVGRIDVRVPQ